MFLDMRGLNDLVGRSQDIRISASGKLRWRETGGMNFISMAEVCDAEHTQLLSSVSPAVYVYCQLQTLRTMSALRH